MSDHAAAREGSPCSSLDAGVFERLFGEQDDRRAALKFDAKAVRGVAHAALQIGAPQDVERQRRIFADRGEDENALVEAAVTHGIALMPSFRPAPYRSATTLDTPERR